MTTTMEVIVVLAGIGNIAWGFHNWQIRQKLDQLIAHADRNVRNSQQLFQTAQKVSQAASRDQEYKVCSLCGRIVTRYFGETCVDCSVSLTQKAS